MSSTPELSETPVTQVHHAQVPQQRGAAPRRPSAPGGAHRAPAETYWQRYYAALVRTVDVVVITACVAVGVMLGSGFSYDGVSYNASLIARAGSGTTAWMLLIAGLWLGHAWEVRVLGSGPAELRRVSKVFASGAIGVGLAGLAFDVHSVKPWVFGILPAAWVLCLAGRYGLRVLLHRERAHGRCQLPVLAVGTEETVADLVRRTRRAPQFGWTVAGACVPNGGPGDIEGVPVTGDLDAVATAARTGAFRVVAVAPAPGWGPGRLQQLAWQLEGTPVELAVDPGLMEIAGPRLHITPIDGMPLLRLTEPRFSGTGRLVKGVMDRLAATVLLLLAAPLLAAVAIAVRRDGGPALYRQERVGLDGRTFGMVKFRSMVVDADSVVGDLVSDQGGVLFKMRDDPRVTVVGSFLRRYSLDELPQLFNVLAGTMSLVGPRPPLPREVAQYGPDAERRLLVKPGITGLWQVSGRSDLSWEESVRLDLRYVENWSMALDAEILVKTVGAVVARRGAY